jgi:sugar/nucleoside kinase (ribokinase family)
MFEKRKFDIAFLGHYTKDTIVTKAGTKIVNGGAYFYGSSAAARIGLKTAAVTRLAPQDYTSYAPLLEIGVAVKAIPTAVSTCLRLEYPTDNPDDRTLAVTSVAEPFTVSDIDDIDAGVWSIGASIRGEVGIEVLKAIHARGSRIGLDAQGFIRILENGTLAYDSAWPEKAAILALVDVFKVDVVEAEVLTGSRDLREAARILSGFGPKEFVLTHADGVVVYAGGVFFEAPFTPREMVGRSGRGDTCLASYLAARITMSPEIATRWAAAMTSMKLETTGPFRGTREDVERVLRGN